MLVSYANAAFEKLLKLFGINLETNYFYNIFCIPDHFWGWIPLTTIKASILIRKRDIDIIYVSCTPHSSAIIGIILKRLSGKPLVIDYRDPFHISAFKMIKMPRFRRKINRAIQEYYLKRADITIVNNEDTKNIYIDEYPIVKNKIFAVHNGFDTKYLPSTRGEKFKKFTIVYTGDFYFYAIYAELVFEAIKVLYKDGRLHKNNFQFLLYGEDRVEIGAIATRLGIEDLVITNARIPYREVLDIISKSHLQLLRIVKPMISTKLFDGIAMNIPFLATIPSGEVEGIIREFSPDSFIVTEESADKVAEAIVDAMSKYERRQIRDNYVDEFIDDYSRENLTLKLMRIIDDNIVCNT